MTIIWRPSIEAYKRIIAEKKHIREGLKAELALGDKGDTWYTRNQLLNINRQIEDLEEWLRRLEEKANAKPAVD